MITIPDPDVVFTDLGLAVLGACFAWRLRGGRGVLVMAGLASAAFWGAMFHAFFPAKTATTAGFVVWLFVALSIAVVAESLLDMTLTILFARLIPGKRPGITTARRAIVLLYFLLFPFVLLFVDESFSTVVLLYAPTLVLALIAAALDRWALIAFGLLLSAIAAVLQQAHVAIHPVYFDHNAVYHAVQAAALVVLYFGFHARRADRPVRAG